MTLKGADRRRSMAPLGTTDRPGTIVCVHMYDDFSGSSNVFSQALAALKTSGHDLLVLVGSHGESGFIRSRHEVRTFPYRLWPSRFRRLLSFVLAQLSVFGRIVSLCRSEDCSIIYVNTILPAGAILAGVICRRSVIVHVHEVGIGSASLFRLLRAIVAFGADQLVCVSHFVADTLHFPPKKVSIVRNSLAEFEWIRATAIASHRTGTDHGSFVVVMACSLRWYKGIDSFLEIAKRMWRSQSDGKRQIEFRLLLNCEQVEFADFVNSTEIPEGLLLVHRPASVVDHLKVAGLLLNLSHVEGCVEAFGLTLLEAMACGVPVVSPKVGGCTELFEDGQGGWRIGSRELDAITALVDRLSSDSAAWLNASKLARAAAERFSPVYFSHQLRRIFEVSP